MGLDNQGFILATLHRPYNTDDKQQLSKILTSFASIKLQLYCLHPRLDAQLKLHSLEIPSNICTTGPIDILICGINSIISINRLIRAAFKKRRTFYQNNV